MELTPRSLLQYIYSLRDFITRAILDCEKYTYCPALSIHRDERLDVTVLYSLSVSYKTCPFRVHEGAYSQFTLPDMTLRNSTGVEPDGVN